jgi:hypothetical protein
LAVAVVVEIVFAIFDLRECLTFARPQTTVGTGSFPGLAKPHTTEFSACVAFATACFGVAWLRLSFLAADLWAVGDAFIDLPVAIVVETITNLGLWEVLLCAFAPCLIGLATLESRSASAEVEGVLGRPFVARAFRANDFANGGATFVCIVDLSVAIVVAVVGALLFASLWVFAFFSNGCVSVAIAPKKGLQRGWLANALPPLTSGTGVGLCGDLAGDGSTDLCAALPRKREAFSVLAIAFVGLVVAITTDLTGKSIGVGGCVAGIVLTGRASCARP